MREAVIISTARTPIGKAYRGTAVAGCEPDEMGIGPVFTVQVIYCRDRLGFSNDILNVGGGQGAASLFEVV